MNTYVEWCLVECGSKNAHQKDMWLKEVELCAPILFATLGLTINIIGGGVDLYDRLIKKENIFFDNA